MAYGAPVAKMSWEKALGLAREQLYAARAGRTIPSLQGSGGVVIPNYFSLAPISVEAAYLHKAYWLAAAARLGYPGLLGPAQKALDDAISERGLGVWSDDDVSKISQVMKTGSTALDSVGGTKDRRLASAYLKFGGGAKSGEIETSQRYDYETSTPYWVIEGTKDVGRRGVEALDRAGRILRDERPPGTPKWLWWLQRNALWLGVGAVTLGVAYVYLRPVLAPLLKVRDAAAAASTRAADKAAGRLDQVARNRRRNPRRRIRRSRR
jgi:hypothetical protein